MKRGITFILRFSVVGVLAYVTIGSVQAQDVSGHETVDNPHLRRTTPTPAASAAQTTLSAKDQKFLSQVAASGVVEVADAKVAQQQGNASVKNIGSRIAADRASNNQELMALAKKKGVTLNTDKLKGRNMGKGNFDKQYLYTVSHDYQEDIGLFQREAQSGDDKDVKAWAGKTLPMLKSHLSMLNGAKGSDKAKPKE